MELFPLAVYISSARLQHLLGNCLSIVIVPEISTSLCLRLESFRRPENSCNFKTRILGCGSLRMNQSSTAYIGCGVIGVKTCFLLYKWNIMTKVENYILEPDMNEVETIQKQIINSTSKISQNLYSSSLFISNILYWIVKIFKWIVSFYNSNLFYVRLLAYW